MPEILTVFIANNKNKNKQSERERERDTHTHTHTHTHTQIPYQQIVTDGYTLSVDSNAIICTCREYGDKNAWLQSKPVPVYNHTDTCVVLHLLAR